PDGNIEVSFLPMADLSVRNFQVKPVQTKKLSETKGYTYFEERDVLLAKITPCFENGKVGLVRTLKNGMGFGSTEYYVFRAKDQILPEYVFFCLLETRFLQEGERSMTGAAGQQRITKSFINNYEISLPDLPTQHRIVAELEAELRVIEGARQLQAAMEARVRAVIGRVWGNPNQTTATA
ncbi:MAG: restriction endonuclease subunit S, partial [Saprospiraceae bacterium]